MLNFVKSLFGKGRLRIEFRGLNEKNETVKGIAKMPYVGVFDEDDALWEFRYRIKYEEGILITYCKIVAHLRD